ncbi:probable nucleoredoxin 1 [Phtheirospermum japonicum]|uniref:protein-disulfide reductase n=1 Tax=Phtheirospermum japonicum TaxID=374723 RepID=A0A830B7I3_9LAMI|nr:probable nucleoredoxin 1 [Phtheirospermum japonicum]
MGTHEVYDLTSIFCSLNRDHLIRNNGDQVKVDSLKGKIVGVYFSNSDCGACEEFTPRLVKVYSQLLQVNEFEIVFVPSEVDNESFEAFFSNMPWLAIPFSDSETCKHLDELFKVNVIPHLVIVDQNGEVLTDNGKEVIEDYGAQGYPFTPQRFEEIKEQQNKAMLNQSLKSLLVSHSRDYVVTSDGNKVSVADLEGKTVGLYFVSATANYNECIAFNPKLVKTYKSLRDKNFEIVMIPDDDDNVKEFGHSSWFSLPANDELCAKLIEYFEIEEFPSLVLIGPDGKTLRSNPVDAIEGYGAKAYPFTPEKLAELKEVERAKREAQMLDSIFASSDCDFVIGKDSVKIPVSDLVGKNILLYFSAARCRSCEAFLPKLIQAYHEINKNENLLEVIFISSDRDKTSFDEHFSKMPWLAIPFGDKLCREYLSSSFKVSGIPTVVAIGSDGKIVSTEARQLIMSHGAKAYPFTAEQDVEIENECSEKLGWPEN